MYMMYNQVDIGNAYGNTTEYLEPSVHQSLSKNLTITMFFFEAWQATWNGNLR